jgi:hypothetical protein
MKTGTVSNTSNYSRSERPSLDCRSSKSQPLERSFWRARPFEVAPLLGTGETRRLSPLLKY